jgi:hypothetical protein
VSILEKLGLVVLVFALIALHVSQPHYADRKRIRRWKRERLKFNPSLRAKS